MRKRSAPSCISSVSSVVLSLWTTTPKSSIPPRSSLRVQGHEIVDEKGEAILTSPEIRLDWDLFPSGEYPWDKLKPALDRVISRERPGVRPLIWKRLEAIQAHNPTFRAVGKAGYAGYLVFGFEDRNLFICESTKSDNATYVFAKNWETFTKLTKAEVILGKLATRRIVHLRSWFTEIDRLFGDEKAA